MEQYLDHMIRKSPEKKGIINSLCSNEDHSYKKAEESVEHLLRTSPVRKHTLMSGDPLEVRQSRKFGKDQFIFCRPEMDGLFNSFKFQLEQDFNANDKLTISYRGGIPKGSCPAFFPSSSYIQGSLNISKRRDNCSPKVVDDLERSLNIVAHKLSLMKEDIIDTFKIERDELGELFMSKYDLELSATEPTTGDITAHSSSHNSGN